MQAYLMRLFLEQKMALHEAKFLCDDIPLVRLASGILSDRSTTTYGEEDRCSVSQCPRKAMERPEETTLGTLLFVIEEVVINEGYARLTSSGRHLENISWNA